MRNLDIPTTAIQTVNFIRTTVKAAGFNQVVIGVSGGVDSAVSCALAVKALGKDNVHVLVLPYKNKQTKAVRLARSLTNNLDIPKDHIYEINIGSAVDELENLSALSSQFSAINPSTSLKTSNQQSAISNIRLGNIMARTRMIILFDYAKKLPALVLGTENKSEHFLGYFTRFGDEASDIEPIRNLYKTEVWDLAKHLKVPEEIIKTAPTAGLWRGQTDERQFGFSYKDADDIIYGLYESKLFEEELIKQGIDKTTIKKVKSWVKSVEFKHHLPYLVQEPALEIQ